jgi:hypothetical protein
VNVRRVIASQSRDGSEGVQVSEKVEPLRGHTYNYGIWDSSGPFTLPILVSEVYVRTQMFPEPGGLAVVMLEFPGGEGGVVDKAAVDRLEEMRVRGGRLLSRDPQTGMHKTATIDVGFVISGEITLIEPDGSEALLRPGDCLVQLGTNHRWENRSPVACIMGMVLLGATQAH